MNRRRGGPRRRGVAVAAAALIALVAVGTGATGTGQPATPHFVEEAVAAGLDHRYDGDFQYFVGGGVATFDCDGDGPPGPVPRRRRRSRPRCFENQSPVGGALPLRAGRRVRRPTSTHVTGAYPIDIDGDGNVDLAVLRVGENVAPARAGRLPRSSAPTRRWGFDGGDCVDRPRSARPGRARTPCRRWRSATTYGRRESATRRYACADNQLVRPDATGTALRDADGPRARAGARCRCCSATGTAPAARDLRVTNDRQYYTDRATARSSSGGSTPGEPPRLYTAADGWQTRPDLGHGHRQLRPHRRRLPGGLPDQPGRQQAPDPGRRARPADVPRHRARARRDRRRAVHRRRCPRPRPPGTPSSRTSTTTATSTCSSRRATSRTRPTTRAKDPSNLLLGQPDGTFVRGRRGGRHRQLRARPRRRARRLQPGRAAGPRRGQRGART